MTSSSLRRAATVALATAAATAALLTSVPTSGAAPREAKVRPVRTVDVQLLALNDFHGALEPPTGSGGRIQTGVGPAGR
jgi:5'-nucleotidase